MKEKLTIIFPVEMMARELDFRLVLASLFAQPHHRILLTHASHAIRLATKLRGGGMYVGKNIGPTPTYFDDYHLAKENGFVIVHLAEEGAVFMGDENNWKVDLDQQLNPQFLSHEDWVATWGDFQRDYYLSKNIQNPKNIKTTGHPRFEIYKGLFKSIYAEEAEKLKSRFGNFVLFNSNLGWPMNPLGYEDTFSAYQGYEPQDEIKKQLFVGRWNRQVHVFAEFIQLVHNLADKHKDLNWVVRPHPSDSMEDFKHIFRGVRNIYVVREGSVVPWILASSVMLNDGCTTAIEAYMMGKPVVNFIPLESKHEIFLPNLLGTRAWNQAEAEKAILEGVRQQSHLIELPERAHQVFANFRSDSIKLFMDVLHEAEEVAPRSNTPMAQLILDQIQSFSVEQTKQVARRFLFQKRYLAAKATRVLFPGFNRKNIHSRLGTIGKITGRYLDMKWFSPFLIELNLNEMTDAGEKRF